MEHEWIVSVHEKEYGPVDLETLREWKREGRLLPQNPARRTDVDLWATAGEIPGLFARDVPPVQSAGVSPRGVMALCAEALRIYRKSFVQFFCFTLLIVLPAVCGQLVGASIDATPNFNVDLRTLLAGAVAFCMFVLMIVLWPVYIAGIQIVAAEQIHGRRIGFLGALNAAIKFWPRLALLCLIVYGVFALLLLFAFAIAAMLVAGATSLLSIFIALVLLALQVWMFGRWFINVLFWQQTTVLEGAGVVESLRRSRQIARGGENLPWYRRAWSRGALIASIWLAFVVAINWPLLAPYLHTLMTASDPQALLDSLKAAEKNPGTTEWTVAIWLIQKILQPLLGIAFVVLYFDSRAE
jgi:GYF domain 2